jgi:hypothetical protein
MDQTQDDVLTMDLVESYMDKTYTLNYTSSYDDNLNDHLGLVQKVIQEQDSTSLWEEVDEWFWEQRLDSVETIKEQLREEIVNQEAGDADTVEFSDDVELFFEGNSDAIEDMIFERDDSDIIKELLRNTSDPVFFYDTGEYIDSTEFDDVKDITRKRQYIKRIFGIPAKEKRWDSNIDIMLCQASYGGRLVVYFRGDIEQWMDIGDNNRIEFSSPYIAIIDNYNGSGDHTDLSGHKFSLPLDVKNVWIDKTLKYNYTYEVCGMLSSWCDGVVVRLYKQNKGRKAKVQKSTLGAMMDVEKIYQDAFDKGGCTYGDMNMRRHRNTYYENNFPCGTHCPTCHTFWID